MGLSYIKEAEEKPAVAATPYYKLAYSYMNRVPVQNSRYAPYRAQILHILQNQLNSLLQNKSFQDLSFYSGVMEQWNDKQGLAKLHDQLMELLNQEIQANDWSGVQEILNNLNHLVTDLDTKAGAGR